MKNLLQTVGPMISALRSLTLSHAHTHSSTNASPAESLFPSTGGKFWVWGAILPYPPPLYLIYLSSCKIKMNDYGTRNIACLFFVDL